MKPTLCLECAVVIIPPRQPRDSRSCRRSLHRGGRPGLLLALLPLLARLPARSARGLACMTNQWARESGRRGTGQSRVRVPGLVWRTRPLPSTRTRSPHFELLESLRKTLCHVSYFPNTRVLHRTLRAPRATCRASAWLVRMEG
jgi:hypothetical protein